MGDAADFSKKFKKAEPSGLVDKVKSFFGSGDETKGSASEDDTEKEALRRYKQKFQDRAD